MTFWSTGYKLAAAMREFRKCRLCPRACGVDRTLVPAGGRPGACGESHVMRVAYVGPHLGEEPPISGRRGSGTMFFTGCPLGCVFCQNYQISARGLGREVSVEGLVTEAARMIREEGVHNISFVSPDQFFPYTFRVVEGLRRLGIGVPVVYNLSGYQSPEQVRAAEGSADIYLPDYKYSDRLLAARYSSCPDYPGKALDAIEEMLRQKGPLDVWETGGRTAERGVLVRHLILPGHVENSVQALTSLFVEFGRDLPLSLMSQYHPIPRPLPQELSRRVSPEEFQAVYGHALELGSRRLFVQFPGGGREADPEFLPDFLAENPFGGNPVRR